MTARAMRLACGLDVLTAAGVAHADEPVTAPPPPSWVANRPKVPDADSKVEGGFPDAIPAIAYDTNTGLGLGAIGHYTLTGFRGRTRSSPTHPIATASTRRCT